MFSFPSGVLLRSEFLCAAPDYRPRPASIDQQIASTSHRRAQTVLPLPFRAWGREREYPLWECPKNQKSCSNLFPIKNGQRRVVFINCNAKNVEPQLQFVSLSGEK